MVCYNYSNELKPYGYKVNINEYLLNKAGNDTEFQQIFPYLYFHKKTSEEQKKCAIFTDNDDCLVLYVCLYGVDNLTFIDVIKACKNVEEYTSHIVIRFNQLEIVLVAYNHCLCDCCLNNHLRTINDNYQTRLVVLDGFVLKIPLKPIKLVDIALEKVVQESAEECCDKCCDLKFNESNLNFWYPLESKCKLKTHSSLYLSEFIRWDHLPLQVPYHILSAGKYLVLFTIPGYIINVEGYPKTIKRKMKDEEKLYFFSRENPMAYSFLVVNKEMIMTHVWIGVG